MRLTLLAAWVVAGDWDSCTTMGFAPGATEGGSTFVTHTNDCVECDSRFIYIPAKDWPEGSQKAITKLYHAFPREANTGRSSAYEVGENPEMAGQVSSAALGYIPQVSHTFAYYEGSYPYMNEHGLAFGESTASSTLWVPEPDGGSSHYSVNYTVAPGEPLLGLTNLMQVALERCITARCAIQLMGDMATKYGWYGEDPACGETLTITDGAETWVFNIANADGSKNGTFPGPLAGSGFRAAWAAQRLPEGHVAVSPNTFTIRQLKVNDTENFMYADGIFEAAVTAGLWDGKGALDFAMVWGPDPLTNTYDPTVRPIPRYSSMRSWRIYSRVAPSLGLKPVVNPLDLPFSVPVDRPITRRDLFDLTRDHYEGTEFDMRVGVLAGPFGNPNRYEGGDGVHQHGGEFPRAISIPRTSTSTVIESLPQHRREAVASPAVAWLATDSPASSVYVPFYASAPQTEMGPYQRGNLFKFTRDSAWWAFNFVANFMNINFQAISEQVLPTVQELQDEVDRQTAEAETSGDPLVLLETQMRLQSWVVDQWWDLADKLVVMFSDGFKNGCTGQPLAHERDLQKCQVALHLGYPKQWLDMIGYDYNIHPHYVRPGGVMKMTDPGFNISTPPRAPWTSIPTQQASEPVATSFGAGRDPLSAAYAVAMVAVAAVAFMAGRASRGARDAVGDHFQRM
eukprot:CAMPEP_0204382908 /NCGR_PEP_ID=MMETSP0469-20131031/55526_1 /ASSEMBLY_ACC=CAM_ASM_000384 /TAXON_ID=2969 /ORGANISM="Oxyrrhis marina" /LENGTH=681 /DNA_ID=CAMNT_0051375111 /DNA_START=8 /DNA_END=2053 /DNA_ORIENTATION=-